MLSPFGAWVRAFREREHITLREMSRALGKSPSFMSAMELGRKSVPENFVAEFVATYELSEEAQKEVYDAATASRTQTRLRFENRIGQDKREVAMLYARNFDHLTEDQTERIRKILEERDGRPKR